MFSGLDPKFIIPLAIILCFIFMFIIFIFDTNNDCNIYINSDCHKIININKIENCENCFGVFVKKNNEYFLYICILEGKQLLINKTYKIGGNNNESIR